VSVTAARTSETITVRDAIVEAIDGAWGVQLSATHGQLCPVWTGRANHEPVWSCNCWHLPRIKRIADAVCAMLDGAQ
jgi:hypothetical protein